MKTVCFVVPIYPTISETFITNQIVGAKKNGYKTIILCHKLEKSGRASQLELINEHAILEDTFQIEYNIPSSKLIRFFLGIFYIVKHFRNWIQITERSIRYRFINSPFLLKYYNNFKKVDVFHVQFAVAGMGIAEMKSNGLLKGKLITTFHGHDAHFSSIEEQGSLKQMYKLLFEHSEYVTVNSSYLYDKVVRLGCKQKKIKIIPMGIDVSYFSPEEQRHKEIKSTVNLISIGRLIEVKGFEYAIKSVKLLVDDGLDVQYTIVGEGRLFGKLSKLIETLGLNKNQIELVGKKNQSEIRTLLLQHHLFLMSSVTDSNGKSEAQGLVTAEAQAMGLPVIAFNSGGVPSTIVPNVTGILIKEKDINSYARAITKLIENPDIYDSMSKHARVFAKENLSKDLMLERFVNLYE